jgi:hypothetical protein
MRETSDSEDGVSAGVGAPRKRLRLSDLLNGEPDAVGGLSVGGSDPRERSGAWAPTDRQQHTLARSGLRPVDTTPNGDCLFEAALATQHGHTPSEEEILALRHDTVAYLRARAEYYIPSFPGTRSDYLREVEELARRGVYMSNIADFAPHALAYARGLRVTVLDENGDPAGGTDRHGNHGYGPADGMPVTLVRLNQGGGHYLGTRPDTGANTHDVDARDVDMTQAHIIYDATPAPSTPQHSGPQIRYLDQGRIETTWPDEPTTDPDGDEVRIVRTVQHRLDPDPAMDNQLPWRAPLHPTRRVYEPYAAEDGSVHPAVLARAHEITAIMAHGKALFRGIARDPHDTRLPSTAISHLTKVVWKQLEHAVATEIQRLTRGEPLATPPVHPARVTADHVRHRPNDQPLINQWGLFLTRRPEHMSPQDRPSLLNGRILGVYLGAVLDNQSERENWGQTYTSYPSYAMDLARTNKIVITMSAEGAANSIAFANTAVQPARGSNGLATSGMEYNHTAINAEFVSFTVRMPDRDGGYRMEPISVLVALENAFDPKTNPDGMIIVDYGDNYLWQFDQPDIPIKTEPE